MEYDQALRESLRYNAAALVPSAVGLGIVVAGLWVGALGPFLETVGEHGVGPLLAGEAGFRIDGAIVFVGVAVGYVIHRVGRTTVLFKLYGDAVVEDIEGVHDRRDG